MFQECCDGSHGDRCSRRVVWRRQENDGGLWRHPICQRVEVDRVIDQVGGAAFTVVAMLSSGICILIHFLISEQVFNWLSLDSMAFWLIALMTIVTTVIPSFLIAEAISLVGPQKTSIAGTVGPAITSVFAVFLLGEAFGPSQLAGIVLVVAAITYMQREPAKAKQ